VGMGMGMGMGMRLGLSGTEFLGMNQVFK